MLPELYDVTYPRHIPFRENSEIHVFGDAAINMGYGACAYVRTFLESTGQYESHLLYAKSRINPKKEIKVPRLELLAALLSAEISDMLSRELRFDKSKIFCYSDSETALWWMTKSPSALHPFVSNRVKKIRDFGYPFQYINTLSNPADIASRGCSPTELNRVLWKNGPAFLRLPKDKWKIPKVDFSKVIIVIML